MDDKENINPQTGEMATRSRVVTASHNTKAHYNAPSRRPLQEIDARTMLPTNIKTGRGSTTTSSANPKTDASSLKKVYYR